MTNTQKQFLVRATEQAQEAGHVFPQMAACEAALESAYGTSALAVRGNNLFGTKQHVHPIYGTLNLPTREFLRSAWTVVSAEWVLYPTEAACFADRIGTLHRLASTYPHYAAALAATDPITYINQVSQTWSTDPKRAADVIAVYKSAGFGS